MKFILLINDKMPTIVGILTYINMVYTYYYNCIMILHTVSRHVDEALPLDHPRSKVSGNPMIWPYPQDVILYARISYYNNNMFIIYLFLILFWIYNMFWSLIQKIAGTFAITLRFLTLRHHVYCLWFHAWNLLYVTFQQKQVTDVSLILKDSDTESENLSLLMWLSVSDCQKTDSSNVVLLSFIGI